MIKVSEIRAGRAGKTAPSVSKKSTASKDLLAEKVYKELVKIKKGSILTYKALAEKIGSPKAIRRVATLVGKNPNPITVPCHRIVRSDYKVGEYTYKGTRNQKMKIKLLTSEGVVVKNGKVIV